MLTGGLAQSIRHLCQPCRCSHGSSNHGFSSNMIQGTLGPVIISSEALTLSGIAGLLRHSTILHTRLQMPVRAGILRDLRPLTDGVRAPAGQSLSFSSIRAVHGPSCRPWHPTRRASVSTYILDLRNCQGCRALRPLVPDDRLCANVLYAPRIKRAYSLHYILRVQHNTENITGVWSTVRSTYTYIHK